MKAAIAATMEERVRLEDKADTGSQRRLESFKPATNSLDMRTLVTLVFMASAFAQQRVDVWVHPTETPNCMAPYFDALKQGTEAIRQSQQLAVERGWLDLARERDRRLRDMEQQSKRLQDRVLDQNFGYQEFRAGAANWNINQEVVSAFAAGRKAHPDFDLLLPAMRIIADGLQPRWGSVSMGEYVECLYVVAKNAAFAAGAREKLLSAGNSPTQTPLERTVMVSTPLIVVTVSVCVAYLKPPPGGKIRASVGEPTQERRKKVNRSDRNTFRPEPPYSAAS